MHTNACPLCLANHRFMSRDCVSDALAVPAKTISNYGAGTRHLRRIQQGGKTMFSRRQVDAHADELEKTGKCEGACERVFDDNVVVNFERRAAQVG